MALIGSCLLYIDKEIAKDGIFYIRAGAERERLLLMELAGEYFSKGTLNYTCHAQKLIGEEEKIPDITVSEEDYTFIRAQSVADALAELDYEVYFSPNDGGVILVNKPGSTLPTLTMFYVPGEDETHRAFRLVALCEMPRAGERIFSAGLMSQSCAMVNFSQSADRIIARAALPENGGVSSEEMLQRFVEEFWSEILPFTGE